MKYTNLYINGEWREGSERQRFDVINPADETVLASVASATVADAMDALDAADAAETADCVRDEIFGPVAAIQTFTDQDDVIARANDTEYGLVAYVFTGDLKRGMQVCERLEYGMVGLNRGLVSDPAAPFGGVKQSGLGREGGHEGMLEFMESQYISTNW
jgi:acyl-CoA reductase-like NAD-dependent aldehyde dehydrogenase